MSSRRTHAVTNEVAPEDMQDSDDYPLDAIGSQEHENNAPPSHVLQSRRLHWAIADTPERIERDPNAGKWTLSAHDAAKIFGPGADQVAIAKVTLDNVSTTFPSSIGVNIEGVDGAHYDRKGNTFATILTRNMDHPAERTVLSRDVDRHLSFTENFPEYNMHNLSSKGISPIVGEGFSLVDEKHPITELLRSNVHMLQVDLENCGRVEDQFYKIGTDVVNECLTQLNNQLKSEMRVDDLTKFGISISPVDNDTWRTVAQGVEPPHVSGDITISYLTLSD